MSDHPAAKAVPHHCPICGRVDSTTVTDSRPVDGGRRRRRRKACDGCGHRWTTVEMAVEEAQTRDQLVDCLPTALKPLNALLLKMGVDPVALGLLPDPALLPDKAEPCALPP
jgi:hypothetical protein